MSDGYIRFVGGSRHNQHLFVSVWHPILQVAVKRELRIDIEDLWKPVPQNLSFQTETYFLIPVCAGPRPLEFFEYHSARNPEIINHDEELVHVGSRFRIGQMELDQWLFRSTATYKSLTLSPPPP